jgi:hypothetical protein
MKYRYNPYCPCGRCRAHGYMGPAVLITIGVLFLLDQMGHMHFGFSWPALLIVIGLIKLLEHSASIAGHVPREYGANLPPNVQQPMPPTTPMYPPQGPITPQPPIASAGFISPGNGRDTQGGQNG